MEVKVMPWLFLAISRSPFWGKGRMQPFVYLTFVYWLYTVMQPQSSRSLNFLVFHTFGGILSGSAAFLFLIFVSTMSSSSWVNCPSLMFIWILIIFMIGLFVTLGNFPNRFLKFSFRMCIPSSWLPAFSLALKVYIYNLLLVLWEKCKYFKMNRFTNKFKFGIFDFYFMYICSRHFRFCSPLQEINNGLDHLCKS